VSIYIYIYIYIYIFIHHQGGSTVYRRHLNKRYNLKQHGTEQSEHMCNPIHE